MSIAIRICLIVGAVLVLMYFLRKIQKSQMKINDAIFWLIFAVVLVILGVFPQIAIGCSRLLGFSSPANFVWLCMIALLLIREFLTTAELSQLRAKVTNLTQEIALRDAEDGNDD